MNVVIEKVQFATSQLVEALNRLLPQLSSDPPTLSIGDLERILHSDSAVLFVAKEGPRTVGMLTLITFRIPTGRRAWIEDVVVDADARGEGIGERLTEAAIDEARRRGARTIDLTSRPSREAANALYQKMGFELRETNVYRLVVDG
ncbi:MAG TPA: GNAT family N-acetyltransferase [Acidimicrobiales bacterium]|jgi:ribosomal protein S18 acetylase RimI-like enzyme|nr:GNAT family N-acetyltransferase [Acidimicrobiales bacterium]